METKRLNLKEALRPYLSDIRFWIIFFFLLRLYGITFPPLEVGHNWRQTDGLMVARNFYENQPNIFYPTVDVAGEKTGIVGCEFPILNYLIYLVSLIFGYDHWYGRLIVLLTSSIGTLFFFKLIQKYFGNSPAFNATIILMVSLWFSYSRKIIPDAFAVSLCIISLFFAFKYLEEGKWMDLLLFFLLAALGCLSKILTSTLLTVLLLPVLSKTYLLKRKAILSLVSICVLLVVCIWYFVWVPYLNTTYEFADHFFMGLTFSEGASRIIESWPLVLKRFYSSPLKYLGFFVFVFSIIFVVRRRHWLPLCVFILPFVSFLILLVKTGTSIIGDHYYILTAIPSMAFIIGFGLANIGRRTLNLVVIVLISVESLAAQIYDFRIREPFKSLESLETIMDGFSKPDDLIAINADLHNPTAMYFAHRRGWVAPNGLLSDGNFVNEITSNGCKWIVIVKKLYGDLNLDNQIMYDSEYFRIYSTKAATRLP